MCDPCVCVYVCLFSVNVCLYALSLDLSLCPQRILSDASITARFTGTVRGVFCPEHTTAQCRAALKRLLALLLFMDTAVASGNFSSLPPRLFTPASALKSSRDVLIKLSAELLSGEGDITRHLGGMGYALSFVQHPLDEYDFSVTSVATDLRDGVRLVRLYEALRRLTPLSMCKVVCEGGKEGLIGDTAYVTSCPQNVLRFPAGSLLQKQSNVSMALSSFEALGVPLTVQRPGTTPYSITAKDITAGHAEKTLALLWAIASTHSLGDFVDTKRLGREVAVLTACYGSVATAMADWSAPETIAGAWPHDSFPLTCHVGDCSRCVHVPVGVHSCYHGARYTIQRE